MARVRKYLIGDRFATAMEAVQWIMDGGWIFIGPKPYHPGWSGSWSINYLHSRAPVMHRAILNPEWQPPKEQDEDE